jgi:uncharacterized protein
MESIYKHTYYITAVLANTKTGLEDAFGTLQDHTRESKNDKTTIYRAYFNHIMSKSIVNSKIPMMQLAHGDLSSRAARNNIKTTDFLPTWSGSRFIKEMSAALSGVCVPGVVLSDLMV